MDRHGAASPVRGRRTARAARVAARARLRQGVARSRRALVPILLASVAAGLAWWIASDLLGHRAPFFAPVSAWVALGFSADRRLRRVGELAVGVALGVLLGDLIVHVIGSGPIQVAVVLAIAALIARLLDRGDLLATQAGVQAVIIVALPAAQAGSPVGRWVDALVGGAVALLVAALSPQDPRRRVRALAAEGVGEIADVLHRWGQALAAHDDEQMEEALTRGRASQPVLDQWRSVAGTAREGARLSPAFRRHLDELGRTQTAAVLADRAMRNLRVLVRRSGVVVAGDHDLVLLVHLVDELASATDLLAAELGAGAETTRSHARLLAVAAAADPYVVAPTDLLVQGLVLLMRSLVVDLLEAGGAGPGEARDALPEI